jgi:hypothetical protein
LKQKISDSFTSVRRRSWTKLPSGAKSTVRTSFVGGSIRVCFFRVVILPVGVMSARKFWNPLVKDSTLCMSRCFLSPYKKYCSAARVRGLAVVKIHNYVRPVLFQFLQAMITRMNSAMRSRAAPVISEEALGKIGIAFIHNAIVGVSIQTNSLQH